MKPLCVEDLSVEQKIGQLLVARDISGKENFDFAMDLIRNHALGGVQAKMLPETKEKVIDPVLEAADYPIFIAETMERGYPLGNKTIAGNISLGALQDPKYAYEFARIMATEVKKIGYNMIWAPDVDLAPKDSPMRTMRCFGSDKELAAKMCCAYMRGFAECGVIGSAKHFPSIMDIMVDTHMEESVSYHTREELLQDCMYPYRRAIEELGPDMMGIETGHVRLLKIDPDYPVTVSKACVDLVRESGFDGLLITDSLAMMGIVRRFGDEKLPGMAVAAGHDLVLPNYRIPLRDAYDALLRAYQEGVFDEDRLNEACRRVLRAQERTLRKPVCPDLTENDQAIIDKINTDCICALTDKGFSPAIDQGKRHLFVIVKPNLYEDDVTASSEVGFNKVWVPDKIAGSLKERFQNSEIVFISEFPHAVQNENVCAKALKNEDVVFVTFCEPAPYQGIDGLSERLRYLIHSMADHVAAIVHVGNPYAMEKVPHVPRLIIGFPHPTCLEALPKVLAGEICPKGKLPINFKWWHEEGQGK